jgi:hypothetical protein
VAEIVLATNEDDRETLAEVEDFRDPLSGHVRYQTYQAQMVRFTFSWTLSRESGESMAKQIRMT